MSEVTTRAKALQNRGAFPAIGPRMGIIENEINMADFTSTASGDSVKAITFDVPVLLIAAGIEVTTACDTSVTLSLGDAEDGTQYVNGQAADTTGQKTLAGPANPVIKAAASQLSLTVGGATCTKGVVRVWAVIADVGSLKD